MSPVLYPFVGIAAIAAMLAALVLIYLLRWVLFAAGFAGLLVTIGAGVATAIDGSDPSWLPILALSSLGALALAVFAGDL